MSGRFRGTLRLTMVGVVAMVICACSDQGPSAVRGAVRVTVATGGLDLDPDGYTVTLDTNQPWAVAINGSVLVDSLVPGAHSVRLNDLANNCTMTGASDRQVDIVADHTIDIAFAVSCTATFTTVNAGGAHTCGLTSVGAAYCWGSDYIGELGDGSLAHRTTPVPVLGGVHFAVLSASSVNSCGVTTGATAYCWGANQNGQLGVGTITGPENCGSASSPVPCSTVPAAVMGGVAFASISVGGDYACGLTNAGVPYCWGRNQLGQLGLGTATGPEDCGAGVSCATAPMATLGGLALVRVTAGADHTCGVTAGGAAYCWGDNGNGALGDGTTTGPEDCGPGLPPCSTTPVAVVGGLTFTTVSAGGGHTCGVTTGGAAYCWGYGGDSELGDGTNTNRASPVAVIGGLSFTDVSAGGLHTCGVTVGGAAYCWGDNDGGRLGDGTTVYRSFPVRVLGGLTFAAVSAGGDHTCGITTVGAVFCWGSNDVGQLGDGTRVASNVPVKVMGSR